MNKKEAQILFEKALDAGKKRNYKNAISLLETLLAGTDQIPDALLYLGRSYHAAGKFQQALHNLRLYAQLYPDSHQARFFIGRTLLAMGLPAKASVYLEPAYEKGKNPQALVLLGYAYLKLKNPEKASAYLGDAVQNFPADTKLYAGYLKSLLVYGIQRFHNEDYNTAYQVFNFLKDNGFKDVLVYLYLGSVCVNTNMAKEALVHFHEALDLAPDDPVIKSKVVFLLYQLGNKTEANALLSEVKEQIPDIDKVSANPAESERYFAFLCFNNENLRRAIHHSKNVLKMDKSDGSMNLIIGESYRRLGELNKAENHFNQAIKKDPEGAEAKQALVTLLWQTNRFSDALSISETLLTNNPGDEFAKYYKALCLHKLRAAPTDTVHLLQELICNLGPDPYLVSFLGMQYYDSGHIDKAEQRFLDTLKIDKNNITALKGLIGVYEQKQDKERFFHAFKRYLDIVNNDQRMRKKYVAFLLRDENYSLAANELMKQLPYVKNKETLLKRIAFCHIQDRKFTEALITYRQLLQNTPDSLEYFKNYIRCLSKLGQHDKALDILTKSMNHFKNAPVITYLKAEILFKTGQLDEALAHFRTLTDSSIKAWTPYYYMALIYKKKKNKQFFNKFMDHAKRLQKQHSV